jgi:hypothetical protein
MKFKYLSVSDYTKTNGSASVVVEIEETTYTDDGSSKKTCVEYQLIKTSKSEFWIRACDSVECEQLFSIVKSLKDSIKDGGKVELIRSDRVDMMPKIKMNREEI